jgi:O-antigen/teichoic acid export membrane protein/polysaccharide pyruvyl transferase WcaK-like protein
MKNKTVFSQSLLGKSLRGGAALAFGTILERLARFIRNMILARLLAPEQFGISAIVIACSSFFEAVTDVGTGKSIIQNKAGNDGEYLNSVWWFNAARGTALFASGFAAAPLFAWFYKDPALVSYMRVAFLTMFWNGLTSTGMYARQRDMNFGTTVWITQGSGLLGTAITLICAVFLRNVWILVIGMVCEGFIRFVLSFILCPIRPHLPVSRAASQDLSRFSRGMAGLPLLTFLVMQADVFVLGRVSTKETLGMYFLALSLANIPVMIFNKIATPLLLPVFSRLQDDLEKLGGYLLSVTRIIWMFGLPLAACMAVFAPEILSVIFGSPYTAMSFPFAVLCVYFIGYISGMPMAAIYMAVGRPELHRNFAVVRLVLVAVLIYPAAVYFGPAGVAGCLLASLVLATFFQVRNMGKIINLPPMQYLKSMKDGVLSAGAAVLLCSILKLYSGGSDFSDAAAAGTVCLFIWAFGVIRNRDALRTAFFSGPGEDRAERGKKKENPPPDFILLGATLETGNMGVNALLVSTVKCILHFHPDAKISLLEGVPNPGPNTIPLHDGREITLGRVGVRRNKNLLAKNHLLRLLLTAFAIHLIPLKSARSRLYRKNPYLSAIVNAKVVADITGGDSFSDIYGLSRLVFGTMHKALIIFTGQRLILLPQTYGPFKSKTAVILARWVFSKAAAVYSRDKEGLAAIESLMKGRTMKAKPEFSYDMAFMLEPMPPADLRFHPDGWLKKRESCLVGFNVSGLLYFNAPNDKNQFRLAMDYRGLMSGIMDVLLARDNIEIVFIPHVFGRPDGFEDDRLACSRIMDLFASGYPGRIARIEGRYTESELKNIIGQCDFFIGSRMHACIAAISQAIPALPLAYSDKFFGVFESLGVGDSVMDLNAKGSDEICAHLIAEIGRRGELSSRLRQNMPKVRETIMSLAKDVFCAF